MLTIRLTFQSQPLDRNSQQTTQTMLTVQPLPS